MPHRRRPRGAITREIVVSAALEVVDREGLDGLTIRGVAEVLEAPPMTLYSTFSSREELLNLMYFEVAGRLFSGADQPDWVEALRSVGVAMRTMLSEHPNWAALFSRPAPPLPSERSEAREALLAKLRDAGMTAEQAFSALSNVILTSLGLMLVELDLQRAPGRASLAERLEALRDAVEGLEPDKLVVTRQALQRLERFQLGEIHQQTLEALLVGLRAWIAPPPGENAPR